MHVGSYKYLAFPARVGSKFSSNVDGNMKKNNENNSFSIAKHAVTPTFYVIK